MEGNAPVILDLEPFKILSQFLLAAFILILYRVTDPGTGTGGRRRCRGTGFPQFRLGRRLGAKLNQRILQLCDSRF